MSPFLWGFVRGGCVANMIGLPLLTAMFVVHEQYGYATVMIFAWLVAFALFRANEDRRPW